MPGVAERLGLSPDGGATEFARERGSETGTGPGAVNGEAERRLYSFSSSSRTSRGSASKTVMSTWENDGRSMVLCCCSCFTRSPIMISLSAVTVAIAGASIRPCPSFDVPILVLGLDLNDRTACPKGTAVEAVLDSNFCTCIPTPRNSLGSKENDLSNRHAWSPITWASLVAFPPGPMRGPCLLKSSQIP